MTHRTIEQLRATETALLDRLKAIRGEIRARETAEVSKLAKSYAKVMTAAAKSGKSLPTPEQLTAMLGEQVAKPKRRRRQPAPE